ncbi:hypothetical protein [Paenibacillus xylaniclasticus]|uniref:hypothetical protein n=1 Tax=Paenibacillus xylaniclasticus TaxID=588083 RepID=UPI000FD6F67D|nr:MULTISPECIES: hypothetical protein [Paenibacillus]GFN30886.1 hypothetical protein PCURB6_11460 [Paenibacillus curdlanolyticus]
MKTGKFRHVLYLAIALAMVLYALPRIEFEQSWTLVTVFGVIWLAFALVIISAQLYMLFGVNEATERQLERIKRERRAAWERRLQQPAAAARYRRSKQ